MNEFPKKINVMGIPFRVFLVPDLRDPDEPTAKLDGITDGKLRTIKVCADQDTRRRWTTLNHEYWHAVFHVIGAGNILSEELEEILAQSMEHAMETFSREHGDAFNAALNK